MPPLGTGMYSRKADTCVLSGTHTIQRTGPTLVAAFCRVNVHECLVEMGQAVIEEGSVKGWALSDVAVDENIDQVSYCVDAVAPAVRPCSHQL